MASRLLGGVLRVTHCSRAEPGSSSRANMLARQSERTREGISIVVLDPEVRADWFLLRAVCATGCVTACVRASNDALTEVAISRRRDYPRAAPRRWAGHRNRLRRGVRPHVDGCRRARRARAPSATRCESTRFRLSRSRSGGAQVRLSALTRGACRRRRGRGGCCDRRGGGGRGRGPGARAVAHAVTGTAACARAAP